MNNKGANIYSTPNKKRQREFEDSSPINLGVEFSISSKRFKNEVKEVHAKNESRQFQSKYSYSEKTAKGSFTVNDET